MLDAVIDDINAVLLTSCLFILWVVLWTSLFYDRLRGKYEGHRRYRRAVVLSRYVINPLITVSMVAAVVLGSEKYPQWAVCSADTVFVLSVLAFYYWKPKIPA